MLDASRRRIRIQFTSGNMGHFAIFDLLGVRRHTDSSHACDVYFNMRVKYILWCVSGVSMLR